MLKGPMLGLMPSCHHLEILNNVSARGLAFSWCTKLSKVRSCSLLMSVLSHLMIW